MHFSLLISSAVDSLRSVVGNRWILRALRGAYPDPHLTCPLKVMAALGPPHGSKRPTKSRMRLEVRLQPYWCGAPKGVMKQLCIAGVRDTRAT